LTVGRPKIVTVRHNDYTGPEMVHQGLWNHRQIPERFLYTIRPLPPNVSHPLPKAASCMPRIS